MNNEFDFNNLVDQIQKEYRSKQETMVTLDIIDIYHHKYSSHEDYIAAKKTQYSKSEQELNSIDIYSIPVKPVLISENVFMTAHFKGLIDNKKSESKELTPKQQELYDNLIRKINDNGLLEIVETEELISAVDKLVSALKGEQEE